MVLLFLLKIPATVMVVPLVLSFVALYASRQADRHFIRGFYRNLLCLNCAYLAAIVACTAYLIHAYF